MQIFLTYVYVPTHFLLSQFETGHAAHPNDHNN